MSHNSEVRFGVATLVAATVALTIGCRPEVPPKKASPDLTANPVALNFAACPTLDENNQPVADVFPDRQTFTLQNIGKATAAVTYTLSGAAADQFKIVTDPAVDTLADGSQADIAVEFTPTHAGDVSATLTIDDGDDSTKPVTVALVGSGSNLPAQPTIKISYETAGSTEMSDCIEDPNGQISNCLVAFPDTFMDQSATLNLKIKNLGCPALKVTGISIDSFDGETMPQYYLDDPAIPPSESSPMLLSIAGSTEANLKVRFEPKDDGSTDDQRYAIVNVTTNSPKSPSSVTLFGLASQPSLYADPTFCGFSEAADTCGNYKTLTNGKNGTTSFQIANGGNSDITIKTAALRAPSHPDRFLVHEEAVKDKVIKPGESILLPVDYTDAPIFVTDLIDVTGESNGMATNTATFSVSGGVQPCLQLDVDPTDVLDFSMETAKTSTKSIQVCNCQTGGLLLMPAAPQITAGATYFNVSKPLTKTSFNAGECDTMDVSFNRPNVGGLQAGTVEISSNDPRYAPKKVTLLSKTDVNEIPVAVLTGPTGQAPSFSIDMSTTVPLRITIDGSGSYDPQGMTTLKPAFYTFTLNAPSGATQAKLTTFTDLNTNISGKKITDDKVLLHFDPMKPGRYRVSLSVEDSTGQKSPSTDLDVMANP